MLSEMTEFIDVLVPRGGKSLVARVQKEARVPVTAIWRVTAMCTWTGMPDLGMARGIVLMHKLRRTGIWRCRRDLAVDRAGVALHLAPPGQGSARRPAAK